MELNGKLSKLSYIQYRIARWWRGIRPSINLAKSNKHTFQKFKDPLYPEDLNELMKYNRTEQNTDNKLWSEMK